MKTKPTILEIFSFLKKEENHKGFVITRIIKIVLGSSVIRAFKAGTKPELVRCLEKIPVNELNRLDNQNKYNAWHKIQVAKITRCLIRCDSKPARFKKGEHFGHAAKIFNLFIGHLVLYSPFFNKRVIDKVKYFLHVPLDSKVFQALEGEEHISVPTSIKSIDHKTYNLIQTTIREQASLVRIPAIYFDDYAWAFDETK